MRAVCKAARNVGLELLLNTFARWPDEHPQLVAVLYDDCASSVALYPAVIDLIKSRNGKAARTIARRALEHLDAEWSRRHAPPAPALTAPAESRTKGRKR
jgi:DNA-binding FadR family transcriptional regulator